ncbi:MAG: GNAT family acetyltransferase [Rhizobiales bacterium]|nr:GNAT family acetyltransferase [Hyphomicrobiales bacterium]
MSDTLTIAPLAAADTDAVVALWHRCGLTRPWNDPAGDIAFAMRGSNSTVLVARDAGAVTGSVMTGHDGHRGWVYYVAVDPDARRRGLGRRIMVAAETWLAERGVAKAELLIRAENAAVQRFYDALGYTVEPRIVMSRWLDGRAPTS